MIDRLKRSPYLAIILFVLCVLIWGSSFILIKKGLQVFSPFQVGAIRICAAGLALLPFTLQFLRRKGVNAYRWDLLLLSALTGSILPAFLFPLAQTHLASATTGALNGLTPLFTLVIGGLFYAQSITWYKGVGITVGLCGSILLILDRPFAELTANFLYSGFAITASMLYGINLNMIKRRLSHLKPQELTGLATLIGLVPMSIYLFGFSDFTDRLAEENALPSLGYVLLLGVMGTALALILFYKLMQLVSPVFAASNTYFIPFVAFLWGLADGETLGWFHLFGLATILVGVYLVSRQPKRMDVSSPAIAASK
jgi:drug/metabolite transporter (DMT)-like permease